MPGIREEADEIRYFVKHPHRTGAKFDEWALDMKIKWIGVDCGSADHPMNTIIAQCYPKLFKQAEQKLIATYGVKDGVDVPPRGILSDYAPETLSKGTDPC